MELVVETDWNPVQRPDGCLMFFLMSVKFFVSQTRKIEENIHQIVVLSTVNKSTGPFQKDSYTS
jgi:hypothetical protein